MGKHVCQSLFFYSLQLYQKRDSGTCIFLRILRTPFFKDQNRRLHLIRAKLSSTFSNALMAA